MTDLPLLDWQPIPTHRFGETYPNTPGWKARDTSRDAASAMAPKAPTLQKQCLDVFLDRGPLTADEVASILGEQWATIRPRIAELAAKGVIHDTGARRKNASGKNAIVWAAQ